MDTEKNLEHNHHPEHSEHTEHHDHEHAEHNEQDDQLEEVATPKRWYKSLWFWIVIVLIVAIAGLLIWFWFYNSARNAANAEKITAQTQVRDDWRQITIATGKVTNAINTATDADGLKKASEDVTALDSDVKSATFHFEDQTKIKNDNYKTALESLSVYIGKLQALTENIDGAVDTDLAATKDAATAAKRDATAFTQNTSYVDSTVGAEFFTLDHIQSIYDKIVTDKAAQAQKAKDAQAAAQKLADDEKAVRNTTSDFTDAFINGDETALRKQMTTAFQGEFDFSQIDAANRSVVRPLSYRITEVKRSSDTKYYVYGRYTQEVVSTGEQYAYDQNYTLAYDAAKKAWLIDVDNAPAL